MCVMYGTKCLMVRDKFNSGRSVRRYLLDGLDNGNAWMKASKELVITNWDSNTRFVLVTGRGLFSFR